MKDLIKQLLPPIVFKGIKSTHRSFSYRQVKENSKFRPTVTTDSYSIHFRRAEKNDETYFVPMYGAHKSTSKAILNGGYYEPLTHLLIEKLLEGNSGDMIHAGTFFGDMLPSFSEKCSGNIYAFEPVLENFILSKFCIEENNLLNVLLFNAALGEILSTVKIDTGEELGIHRGGGSRIGTTGQTTTLFSIDLLGLKNLAVLQLDVEGAELRALNGAVETIKRNHPVILIEDNENSCSKFLNDLGYSPQGSVPGLGIWSTDEDSERIKKIAKSL